MEFMTSWNLAVQALFIIALVLGSALVVNIFFLWWKPTLSRRRIAFLYAFSAGFIMPLSLKGLLGSAYEEINHHFSNSGTSAVVQNIITMAIIGSGIVTICASYFGINYLLVRKEIHENHDAHRPHPDAVINLVEIDTTKRKWLAIIFIIMHRVPAGITLGLLIYGLNNGNADDAINLGLLIAFIIHVIPESLIVFYRQIQMGKKPLQAFGTAMLVKIVLIPFIFIGLYLAQGLKDVYWIFPLIVTMGASAMAFTVMLELLPELFHFNKKSNKEWYKFLLLLMIGFLLSALILVIDKH